MSGCSSFAFASLFLMNAVAFAADPESQGDKVVRVNAQTEMRRLLKEIDRDGDRRITVRDPMRMRTSPTFWLRTEDGSRLEVSGVTFLSNLLQELKISSDVSPRGIAEIHRGRIFENPATRLSRLIRETYWKNLTRKVDAENLNEALADPKLPAKSPRVLYVPADDESAYQYFSTAKARHPEWHFDVRRLPRDGEFHGEHGLLSLALRNGEGVPFVVPGGRFNEMYGWDSYFESLGLLNDGRTDLARAMVDNFVYEIDHYGKILNANRTYYLNRSQPPFLTSMIRAVYAKTDKNAASQDWLRRSLRAAMKEYFQVWTSGDRMTATGLSRYFGSGHGIPPEVEKSHFDWILRPAAKRLHLSVEDLRRRFNQGLVRDEILDDFFSQDGAVRESGHDTTYRWRVNGKDRAADFVTVDLNSLLYKYEIDFARLIRDEFADHFESADGKIWTSAEWRHKASSRRTLMRKYLWSEKESSFFDYNFRDGKRSSYVSATAFYPLWAIDAEDPSTKILDYQEAVATTNFLLKHLEQAGGVASTDEASLASASDPRIQRQWEYPNGWAPHQMLIWQGLLNYGRSRVADRLIYKWLYMITKNAADYNGTVPEKYDVVKRSHAVFAEYGNVGTNFSYITREGFGWMNASYQVGLAEISPRWKTELENLMPPEWLDF